MNSRTAVVSMLRIDLIGLRSTLRVWAVIVLTAVVISVLTRNPSVGLPMVAVTGLIIARLPFNSDEAYGMKRLWRALPIPGSAVVDARYLLITMTTLACMVLTGVLFAVSAPGPDQIGFLLPATCLVGAVLGLASAVQLPIIIRFGARYAGIAAVAILGLLGGVVYFVVSRWQMSPAAAAGLADLLPLFGPAGLGLALVGPDLAHLVSPACLVDYVEPGLGVVG